MSAGEAARRNSRRRAAWDNIFEWWVGGNFNGGWVRVKGYEVRCLRKLVMEEEELKVYVLSWFGHGLSLVCVALAGGWNNTIVNT